MNYQEPVYIKPLKEAQYVTERLHALPEVAQRSHRLKNSVCRHIIMGLWKKKSQFQLCDYCCSTSDKVFSFGVLCKFPLQMEAALLYEMSFCFVIFKNIYFLSCV